MTKPKRYIALVSGLDGYEDSFGYKEFIGQHITDWSEVSDEDFNFLVKNLWRLNPCKRYFIIERHDKTEEFIAKTIVELTNQLKKEAEADRLAAIKYEQEKVKRKEKSDQRKKENLLKLLAEQGFKVIPT